MGHTFYRNCTMTRPLVAALLLLVTYVAVTSAKYKGSDSDECWACTDMSANLCKKECQAGCDKKGKEPPNNFERGERKWTKCFDKCENKCSKKYLNQHCMAL